MAMVTPSVKGQFVWIQHNQMTAIAVGLGGSLLATTAFGRTAAAGLEAATLGRAGIALGGATLGGFALTKVITVGFNPFLYFRF